MDVFTVATITITLMLILVVLGVHVAIALSLLSLLGVWMIIGDFNIGINILSTTAFHAVRDYTFGVIPLFVLMGLLTSKSGAGSDLYSAFNVLLRRIRGGLGIATVGANAIFATITGVSVASAAVFSKVALKPMTDMKYDKKFALGTIAGSSVLGMLIPPSLLLIFYGMLAEVSIGKMFVAGLLPGLLLSLIYSLGIFTIAKLKPDWAGGNVKVEKKKWSKHDVSTLLRPWPLVVLMVLILGGIYAGWFTPTEAGGVGAFGALLLVLFKRKLSRDSLWSTLLETGYTSASILLLLIAASMYSRMLSLSGILGFLNDFFASLSYPPTVIIFIFILILLLLGTVLDSTSILMICMPIMVPIVIEIGYDLIHFGIIAIVAIEMGMLTPPFGLVVYSMKSALGKKANVEEIFIGSAPFLIMMFLTLVILVFFPFFSTWLPSLM